jgi:glycolate oxidase
MYKIIDNEDILYFISLLGKENVIQKENIKADYHKDELGTIYGIPELLLFVHNTEEVSSIMKYATSKIIPVTVRGAGTGLVGGCVAIHGGILLDTSKMNHILELDENNLTLTVEAGVLIMDIFEYVESRGFYYPPNPGETSATIGGNIATNAGGMKAVKYGVTRDFIRAIEVVMPSGEIELLGRKVVKDSSGYSLKNLIIGSEGTLAIITKAILKIIPKPKHFISLLIPYESVDDALESVTRIGKLPVLMTAIEFFERETIGFAEEFLGKKFPDSGSAAYILVAFDAMTSSELKASYELVANLCLEQLKAMDVYIVDTQERSDSVWKARSAFLEAIKASTTEMDECDVVLPRNSMASYIKFIRLLSKKHNMRLPSFGHAGDGNLHIYLCKDQMSDSTFEKTKQIVFDELYLEATVVGGLVSGEHGIGYAKMDYLKKQIGKTQIDLMKHIKNGFDPNHILNPDKVI